MFTALFNISSFTFSLQIRLLPTISGQSSIVCLILKRQLESNVVKMLKTSSTVLMDDDMKNTNSYKD